MLTPARAIGVLASGRGSNFEALARAAARHELGAPIVVLVSDDPTAPALDRARALGIEPLVLPVGRYRTRIEDESIWIDALRARGVDLVLLAGFMRRLHAPFLAAFADRVLNIHPSLLPAYPGLDAVGRALAAGARAIGCTVHLVDDQLDHGPILGQVSVEVRAGDTTESLGARLHEAEHRLYPEMVRRFVTEPWRREDGRIVFESAGGSSTPRLAAGAARV